MAALKMREDRRLLVLLAVFLALIDVTLTDPQQQQRREQHQSQRRRQQQQRQQPVGQRELRYVIQEELVVGTAVADIADDAGLVRRYGPEVVRSALRFRFLSAPRVPVSVDERTGRVSTTGRLDREEICADAGENVEQLCTERLDVVVQPMSFFEIIKVSLEILDINDNDPEFPAATVHHELIESSPVGSSFVITPAVDRDTLPFAVQRYELRSASSDVDDSTFFDLKVQRKLDSSTDVRLVLVRPLDRESRDLHRLTVTAYDGGVPPRSGSVQVRVAVTDANDNGPVFETSSYEVTVLENLPLGTTVDKVTASDNDIGANAEIEYYLSPSTLSSHGRVFAVNSSTGAVTVVGPVDRESASVYRLLVSARDRGPDSVSSSDTIVIIHVQDVNDNAPDISINTLLASAADVACVPEEQDPGTFVAHIVVRDPDYGRNGRFNCTLGGSGATVDGVEKFRLSAVGESEFQVLTTDRLDRETTDAYRLRVQCQDGGEPALVSSAQLNVQVTDINDHTPQFERTKYVAELLENNYIGVVLIQVKATDLDQELNSEIVYGLHYNDSRPTNTTTTTTTTTTTMPDISSLFEIDPSTGIIKVRSSLDREQRSSYHFEVTAADRGSPRPLTATAAVTVVVQDVNDEAPRFLQPTYTLDLDENLPAGTQVTVLVAEDADAAPYNRFTYLLRSTGSSAGDVFDVDPRTGRLTTMMMLDHEEQDCYQLIAVVRDLHQPLLSSTAVITINVVDANDNSPVWIVPTDRNTTIAVSSRTPVGTAVTRVRATDLDRGDNSRITYHQRTSTEDSQVEPVIDENRLPFRIDQDSGAIRIARDLSSVVRGDQNFSFVLTLMATDHGRPQRQAAELRQIIVVVSGRLQPPAHFGSGAGSPSAERADGAGGRLLLLQFGDGSGGVILAAAAACGTGLVLLLLSLAVVWCVVSRRRRRRRRDDKRLAAVNGANYNCRIEALKASTAVNGVVTTDQQHHQKHRRLLSGSHSSSTDCDCDRPDILNYSSAPARRLPLPVSRRSRDDNSDVNNEVNDSANISKELTATLTREQPARATTDADAVAPTALTNHIHQHHHPQQQQQQCGCLPPQLQPLQSNGRKSSVASAVSNNAASSTAAAAAGGLTRVPFVNIRPLQQDATVGGTAAKRFVQLPPQVHLNAVELQRLSSVGCHSDGHCCCNNSADDKCCSDASSVASCDDCCCQQQQQQQQLLQLQQEMI